MTNQDSIYHPSQPQRFPQNAGPKHRLHLAENDPRLKICVLASGSKGNATYIASSSTSILIDAGLSGAEIVRRLQTLNIHPESLSGILVTHEHSDHIQGVGVLSRRFRLPVYITQKTHQASPQLGRLCESHNFQSGSAFRIDELHIRPFSISHDARDPVGFVIAANGIKVGIATDLGAATGLVITRLKNCVALILEANHDPEMLINGPYPWPLKQRIQSRNGHLSNLDTCCLLQELKHNRLKHVILAHLSETNNSHQKAFNTIGSVLNGCNAQIEVARQDRCSKLIRL